jgi:phosphopantetheine adenylyltransferase
LAYWHRFVISIAKRYENVKQSLDKKDNEEKILKDIKNRFLSSLYLDISSIN